MTQELHRIGPFDLLLLTRALGKRHFEGVLHLEDAATERHVEVYFVGGSPTWCRTDDVLYGFAAHALRRRVAPPDVLRGLIRRAEEDGALLEDLLISESILDAPGLLRAKTALSAEVFDQTMAAATLDYRVHWTRTMLGSGVPPALEPWTSFFRVAAAGANADFQRAYVRSRRPRSLRPTPELHAMLGQVREIFGDGAWDVVGMAVDGATVASVLERAAEDEKARASLFALIFSRLVSCRDGVEQEPAFSGLERPAAPTASPAGGADDEHDPAADTAPQDTSAALDAELEPVGVDDLMAPVAGAPPGTAVPDVAAAATAGTAPAAATEDSGFDIPLSEETAGLAEQEQFIAGREAQDNGWAAMAIPVSGQEDEHPERGDPSVENALSEVRLKLQKSNAYRALDVPKDATFSHIREAHSRMKRKYAESQYRTFVLGRRAYDMLEEIGQLVDRAARTLTDPRLRAAHDKQLGLGDGTLSEDLKAAYRAESSFATGRQHAKGQDWDSAAMAFRAAIELFPKDAAYHAWYAWALSRAHRAGSTDEPDVMEKVWRQLDHALQLNPRLTAAHLFRARIAKEGGDGDAAMEAWQKVLANVPDHQEALNEMRVLRESGHRRGEKKGAKKSGMSVLGGLFRSKTRR